MNFNFLDFQYTDQVKSLVAPDTSGSGKKNFVTNKAHENFSGHNAQNTQKSDDNKSFAEMMNKLQKQKDSGQASSKAKNNDEQDNIRSSAVIHTPVAKANEQDDTQLMDIASLNAEIMRILSAQSNQDLKAEGTEAKVLLVTTAADEEEATASLLKTLQMLQDKIKAQITEIGETKSTSSSQAQQEELSLLETISTHLDKILESEDNILVITNQRPEDITRLQSFVFDLLSREINQQDEEMLAALAAQWSDLIPPLKDPQKKSPVNEASRSAEVKAVLSPELSKAQDTLSARDYSQERYDTKYSLEGRIETQGKSHAGEETSFRNLVQGNAAKEAGKPGANTAEQGAGQRFLQNAGETLGTLFSSAGEIAALGSTQQAGINQANALLQNIATNPITQSSHATQAHPATQAVAVNIQRAVKGGENSNIRIQLDPPELGRVEVKMSIDKDNVSKIVLTVEKPETYALLQRDAHALERALQDSGLNTENNLSFELADKEHNFNANDRGADSSGQGKSGNSGGTTGDDGDLIETTMDLQVDPATGRIRYNILV